MITLLVILCTSASGELLSTTLNSKWKIPAEIAVTGAGLAITYKIIKNTKAIFAF